MSKFQVGDKVRMPGIPIVVEVLECLYGDDCEFGPELFRYKDPESGEDDWSHSSEFEEIR